MFFPCILFLVCSSTFAFAKETVCDVVVSGRQSIQGVVIYPNGMGDLFVGNEAFSFQVGTDLAQDGRSLHLKKPGVHVEKHFPGVYLNGGSQIYNVYGLFTNSSSNIFFIMINDQENSFPGFYYDLVERRAIELDQAVVSSPFPFVYFSDNENSVFLYQIPMYTFQARFLTELNSVQKTGYFAFNSFDKQMEFRQVDLTGITDPAEKLFKTMSAKMLLRSGFIFGGQVFQITEENVYVLSLEEMQTNPMPVPVKMALNEFLLCSEEAIANPTDWQQMMVYGVAAFLVVVIFVLCYLILTDNSKHEPGRAHTKEPSPKSRKSSSRSHF